jgi:hypothetical protein
MTETVAPAAASAPQVKFVKKTLKHKLQEIALRININRVSSKLRTIFVIEPLKDDEKEWFEHLQGTDICTYYPHRCGVCLEPATHVERCTEDSTYHRYLCVEHIHDRRKK